MKTAKLLRCVLAASTLLGAVHAFAHGDDGKETEKSEHSHAHVEGDIEHQRLSVDPGAYFEGRSICLSQTDTRKTPEKLTARLRQGD